MKNISTDDHGKIQSAENSAQLKIALSRKNKYSGKLRSTYFFDFFGIYKLTLFLDSTKKSYAQQDAQLLNTIRNVCDKANSRF